MNRSGGVEWPEENPELEALLAKVEDLNRDLRRFGKALEVVEVETEPVEITRVVHEGPPYKIVKEENGSCHLVYENGQPVVFMMGNGVAISDANDTTLRGLLVQILGHVLIGSPSHFWETNEMRSVIANLGYQYDPDDNDLTVDDQNQLIRSSLRQLTNMGLVLSIDANVFQLNPDYDPENPKLIAAFTQHGEISLIKKRFGEDPSTWWDLGQFPNDDEDEDLVV